jgi:hypothetical protein
MMLALQVATAPNSLFGSTVAGAATVLQQDSIYNVANNGMCLDANSTDWGNNGDQIQLFGCDGNITQDWTLSGDEFIVGVSGNGGTGSQGLCLDANSTDFPSDGDNIQLWTCNSSSPEQQWTLESNGNIENVSNPAYCIDANSVDYPDNLDPIQLWSCATNDEQVWGTENSVCPDIANAHEYAMQYTAEPNDTWWGESGNFLTTNPGMPNYTNNDSLSHLYMESFWYSYAAIEVGDILGDSETSPHYYYDFTDKYNNPHETFVAAETPTIGDTYYYALEYGGKDYGTGDGKWIVFWDTYSYRSIEVNGLLGGQPMAGAEVQTIDGATVDANAQGKPAFQIQDDTGAWSDWTSSAAGTHFCWDPGLSFTEHSAYQDFSGEGDIN